MLKLIKEFKIAIGAVATAVPIIFASYAWISDNMVFAAEFGRFKNQQELRWTMYDEQRLRSEYYDLRNLREMSNMDKRRLDTVKSELNSISKKRLQIEQEQRHGGESR